MGGDGRAHTSPSSFSSRARVTMPLTPLHLCQMRKECVWLCMAMVALANPSQLWKGMCGHDHTTYTIWLQLCLGNIVGSSLGRVRPARAFTTLSSHSYLNIVPSFISSPKRDWANGRRREMVMVICPVHPLFWDSVRWPLRRQEE